MDEIDRPPIRRRNPQHARCAPHLLSELIRDDRGQTTIEYALLTGIIAVAAISVLQRIRVQIVDIFQVVQNALDGAPVGDAG